MFVKLCYWNCSGDRGTYILSSVTVCWTALLYAFLFLRKTRNPVFVGRDWKEPRNFGRGSRFPGKYETQDVHNTLYAAWPLANHKMVCSIQKLLIIVAGLFAHYAFLLLPSIPPPLPLSLLLKRLSAARSITFWPECGFRRSADEESCESK